MENIDPKQLNEWISIFWSIGWRGLIVFSIIYYRELVIYTGKAIIDLIFKRHAK